MVAPDCREIQIKEFLCGNCKTIPWEPEHCSYCDTLYCGACLAQMKAEVEAEKKRLEEEKKGEAEEAEQPQNTPEEPKLKCKNKKCKAPIFKTQKMQRLLKNIMGTFEIEHKCEAEGEQATMCYEELYKHFSAFKCSAFRPLKCQHADCAKAAAGMNKEELKEHLLSECQEVTVKCQKCELEMKRKEYNDEAVHDCRGRMKKEIDDRRAEVKKLQGDLQKANRTVEDNDIKIKELTAMLEEKEKQISDLQKKLEATEMELKTLKA